VNRAYEPRAIVVPFAAHGLAGRYTAFNVQGGTAQGVEGDFAVEVPARGFRLLALRRDPGVLWTDSVAAADCGAREAACGGGMSVTVRGPAQVPGFLQLATPPPTAVLENGVLLRRAATTSTAGTYAYDDESGLLSLAYSHQREQRIEVHW
jgi:hypothetical protein